MNDQTINRQSRSLRLCYAAYSPLDLRSANSIQTFGTLRELSKRLGENLTAIVPRFGGAAPPPFPARQLARIPVNKLSRLFKSGRWSYLERALYAGRAERIIASVKPDLIYTRDLVCADRFIRDDLPVLYEVHDLESKHPGQHKSPRLIRMLERMDERALRGARGIVSLTATFREEVIARGWQPAGRVFVVPDAYDRTVYYPRDRAEMRAALGLPQDAPILAYAGLTFKYRGLDVLLNAFRQLPGPDALLVLIGGRDFELVELKTLAREIGIADRVHFPGRLEQSVIAQYLAAADALVIPDTVTDATASPLKMFEYMAMARPIVCVDRASLREILGDAALYFPRGDAAALAGACRRALAPGTAALGQAALELASDYTYARRAEKILDAAEHVLALPAPSNRTAPEEVRG